MRVDTQITNVAAMTAQLATAPKTPAQHQDAPAKAADQDSKVQVAATDSVSLKIELPRHELDLIQRFGDVSEFLTSTAKSLRQTDQGLGAASEVVTQMKAQLEKIIKNFPPFNADSMERKEILMSYNALQKQIASMTIPPPPPPIYEKVKHLWQGLFPNQDRSFGVMPLPPDAPDSHVAAASTQLDTVGGQIDLVKSELGNSVRS